MKKRNTVLAAVCAAAIILTACGKNSGAGAETSATQPAPETTTTTTAAEIQTEPAAEAVPEDNAGEDSDGGGEEIGAIQFSEENNPLRPLAEAAVSDGEWPFLWEVTDPDMIKDFFCVDTSDPSVEQAIFIQCPMSANMTEIHIIKAADVKKAKEMLEARKDKAKNMDAFYPEDVEKAESSIVGTEGDYAYFIMASDGTAAETALVNAIKAL